MEVVMLAGFPRRAMSQVISTDPRLEDGRFSRQANAEACPARAARGSSDAWVVRQKERASKELALLKRLAGSFGGWKGKQICGLLLRVSVQRPVFLSFSPARPRSEPERSATDGVMLSSPLHLSDWETGRLGGDADTPAPANWCCW